VFKIMGTMMPRHEWNVGIVFQMGEAEQDKLIAKTDEDLERRIGQKAALLLEKIRIATS
jgi:hypothetical protein